MSDQVIQPASSAATESAYSDSGVGSLVAVRRGPGAIRTVWLMAQVTLLEALRRKIIWFAAIAGAAFLALFWAGLHSMLQSMSPRVNTFNRMEAMGMMTMMALYAGSMMTSLMAALVSCDTLSGEIASGTIHAIATKPVNRWCLVLGKWIGFAVMLSFYVLLIEGGVISVGLIEGHHATPHTAAALCLVWVQSMVLLGVTMLCSTQLSALTAGACSLGLYGIAFAGGWIEQFGALRHIKGCVDVGILASLIMPSDALWRKVAMMVQPPILGAAGVSPFASSMVPNNAMVVYAAAYALAALLIALIVFERRDL